MTTTPQDATREIRMQVMWNRLISVVEEQALTLLRTAFSTSVREAGDLSAGVFDPQGRMLAQARRLLKPGGEMVIVDFAPHDLEFLRNEHAHRRLGLSQNQMIGWATAAGLDVEAVREFPSGNGERGLTVCLWRLKDRT